MITVITLTMSEANANLLYLAKSTEIAVLRMETACYVGRFHIRAGGIVMVNLAMLKSQAWLIAQTLLMLSWK